MFKVHKLNCLSLRVHDLVSVADDDEKVESDDGRILHSLAADKLIDGSTVTWLFVMSGVFITTAAGAARGLPLNTDDTENGKSGSVSQSSGVLGSRPLRCRVRVEAAARRSTAAGAVVVEVVEVVGRASLAGSAARRGVQGEHDAAGLADGLVVVGVADDPRLYADEISC